MALAFWLISLKSLIPWGFEGDSLKAFLFFTWPGRSRSSRTINFSLDLEKLFSCRAPLRSWGSPGGIFSVLHGGNTLNSPANPDEMPVCHKMRHRSEEGDICPGDSFQDSDF